jgi:carboxylate-amine ligase
MQLGQFKTSDPYTMGVELELQLINLSNFDLTASSPDLIYLLGKHDFPGSVTPEMTESMIEIATDVMHNYDEISTQLHQIRNKLVEACDKLNIGICGGGTHPFQRWSERKIYNKERYREASKRYGYLAKQFTVFGQHVHIGCESGDSALYLLHALNRYVPHFIALSASSPYVQGADTAFNSARLNSVFAFPLSGHAPFILNWEQFDKEYFARMHKTGTINSMKDFYWDIRPKPEYGTIELRVCDTPLNVEKAAVLAVYLQALCHYILEDERPKVSENCYMVYNYNRFQACRFGMEGKIVDPVTYSQKTIHQDILDMIHKIELHAITLGSEDAFLLLKKYIKENNDATYLRRQFAQSESMEYIIDNAIAKFRQ